MARSGTHYNHLEGRIGPFVLPPMDAAPLTVQEIPRADVQVSIGDGRVTANPGDILGYTIFFTNASPITIENVILTTTLEPADYLEHLRRGVGGNRRRRIHVLRGLLAPQEAGSTVLEAHINSDIPDTFWTVTATVEIGYGTAEEVIEENLQNNTDRDVDILRARTWW